MRDLIRHVKSGLEIDFAEDDFGGPEQAELVRAWREGGHHTDQGALICIRHENYERPWLCLRELPGQLIAAHWPRTGMPEHRITHGVSDEHRRQVEYLQLAGEAAGFKVQTEVVLPTHVRPDAVIYGSSVNMGVEVQRSGLTVPNAKARTTKARRADVWSVWFADSGTPKWLYQVPSVRMNADVRWDAVPLRGSVTVVSGVRVIEPRRCWDIPGENWCPKRSRGCSAWHAIHHPRMGLVVDDVAAMFPAGELIPMRYRTFRSGDYVLLVTPADRDLYEEVNGRSGEIPLKEPRQRLLQPGRIECAAIVGNLIPLPVGVQLTLPLDRVR